MKRIITLAAGLLLSLSASAGYVQYTFKDVTFSDGGTLAGHFIQDDLSGLVRYYELSVSGGSMIPATFAPSTEWSNILAASNYFGGLGPTSFLVFDALLEPSYREARILFDQPGISGEYAVKGWHEHFGSVEIDWPEDENGIRYINQGTAVQSTVTDPNWLFYLESGVHIDGINHIVPQLIEPAEIPEPSSIVLMILGAAAMLRRSKAAPPQSSRPTQCSRAARQ